MVSIRTFLILLVFVSICFSKPSSHFSYTSNLEFSEQIREFYEDVMVELYYNVELNEDYHDNETKIFKNTFSTYTHNFNFSHHQLVMNKVYFSPLMAFTFSYKKMRYLYKSGSAYLINTTKYKNTNIRNARLFIGLKPEFCYKAEDVEEHRRTPVIAIKPTIMIGESIYWGTLDRMDLTIARIGTDINIELLRKRRNKYKGIAFTFFSYFDYTITSDRAYGETYGLALKREVQYPKKALIYGFSIGNSIRRFKDEK